MANEYKLISLFPYCQWEVGEILLVDEETNELYSKHAGYTWSMYMVKEDEALLMPHIFRSLSTPAPSHGLKELKDELETMDEDCTGRNIVNIISSALRNTYEGHDGELQLASELKEIYVVLPRNGFQQSMQSEIAPYPVSEQIDWGHIAEWINHNVDKSWRGGAAQLFDYLKSHIKTGGSEWISVEAAIPDTGETIEVKTPEGETLAYYDIDGFWFKDERLYPTHWRRTP